jgi:hypothetical protein
MLTEPEFRAEHAARPGLIPVRLDAVRRRALWVDLTGYHCYDGSFRRSLAAYATILAAARRPSAPWHCESSLDFLRSAACDADCISPGAFIFHAGRCGSTLLAKVIARSQEHMVFGEGGPHNQIWGVISGSRRSAPILFRNLLLHTGRRRLPSYRAHIVKFTSFNVLQFETIRTAFPEVPALFLFRKPAQILASYRRESPGWMGKDTEIGTIGQSAEAAVTKVFQAALGAGKDLVCLDYADLTPDTLPGVLGYFHLDPCPEDLALMRAEFRWDAKTNRLRSTQPVSAPEFEFPVSQELQELYKELSARKADFRSASNIDYS